jgi:hypothetical protein
MIASVWIKYLGIDLIKTSNACAMKTTNPHERN